MTFADENDFADLACIFKNKTEGSKGWKGNVVQNDEQRNTPADRVDRSARCWVPTRVRQGTVDRF